MTLTSAPPTTYGFDPDRLGRIDRHLARYVEDGRLAGWELALTHEDSVVHTSHYGWRDREAAIPVDGNTVWRIASMTKPVTAVAAMTLWEQGVFALNDQVSRWIPAFADARVYIKGTAADPHTEPVKEPVRVWHLLAHTSGLTAGFMYTDVVDQMYREAGFEWGSPRASGLTECVDLWARLPLRFEPGTAWGYGVSSDVLGRLVEIWTGQRLDEAFTSLVTAPLGMHDTRFQAGPDQESRLPRVYHRDPATDKALLNTDFDASGRVEPAVFSGGGGLISTIADYTRFTRMLAGEGTFDGTRLLAPATIRLMRANHLGGDLADKSTGGFAETSFEGIGFGLGFANVVDHVRARSGAAEGEFFWGGAFSTLFWVDPIRRITCTFMSQLFPSSSYPLRAELRQLVYSAFLE